MAENRKRKAAPSSQITSYSSKEQRRVVSVLGRFCSTALFSLTVVFKFQEMYPKGYFQLITHISMIVKINKKNLVVAKKSYLYLYTIWCLERWKKCLRASRFHFFLGGIHPDPPSKRLRPLVNTVASPSQTGCPLQTLLKALMAAVTSHEYREPEFLAIPCNWLKARKKSRIKGASSFGIAFPWFKIWRRFKPITWCRNPITTFNINSCHIRTWHRS